MDVEIYYTDFDTDTGVTEKKHTKYQGIVGCLGPTMPEQLPLKQLFITLSISPKEAVQLNKGCKRKWGDYTVKEQLLIITRYQHFLKTISEEYSMYYEFTSQMNIHVHCIVLTSAYEKDIRVKSKRFFSINPQNQGFIDIRPVTDYDNLVLYLTGKDVKKYQTTGIAPIIVTNK